MNVSNIGNQDAQNVVITGQSNVETNAVNSNKISNGGTLRQGYSRAFEVSVYVKPLAVSTVTVTATASNGGSSDVVFSDCSKLDQDAINKLNWVLQQGEQVIHVGGSLR